VTVIGILVVLDLFVLKKSINPVRILGYVFVILAISIPTLWASVEGLPGSGVPPNLDYGNGLLFFEISCLAAAIGLFLSSMVFHSITNKKKLNVSKPLAETTYSFPPIFSISLLSLWILGQGPSLLDRSAYLFSDGIPFLLKPTALLAPILSMAIFGSELATKKNFSKSSIFLLVLWMTLLAGISSRLAILPLGLLSLSILFASTRKLRDPLVRSGFFIVWLYVTTWAVLVLFFASFSGRGQRHGLQNLASTLTADQAPNIIVGQSWWNTLENLIVSIASIYPITNISASSPIDPSIILLNANPLPSELLGLENSNSSELILPWLPKSLIGELLGTFGVIGVITAFALMATLALVVIRFASRRNQDLVAIVVGLSLSLALLSALQYPSRISLRFFSAVYFAPVLVWLIGIRSTIFLGKSTSTKARDLDWKQERTL
jgi:hypothetical protein